MWQEKSRGTASLIDWGCLDQTWAWLTGRPGLSVDWQLLINTLSAPDVISIQPVHHTLTCHMDSGVPLAPVQPSAGVGPHSSKTDRRSSHSRLTGSCPARARTSREMSGAWTILEQTIITKSVYSRSSRTAAYSSVGAFDTAESPWLLSVTVRQLQPVWERQERVNKQLALCLALLPPPSAPGEQRPSLPQSAQW